MPRGRRSRLAIDPPWPFFLPAPRKKGAFLPATCFPILVKVSENAGPVLLIDGECVLCNRFSQFVIRRDPAARFRFAALQSHWAKNALNVLGQPTTRLDSVVLIHHGQAFYRSEAALRTLALLPFPWSLARWGLWIPRLLRDGGYNLVARTRVRLLGRTTTCGLLSPAERARFLLD